MGKTKYDSCKELLDMLKEEINPVGFERLRTEIMKHIGGQKRTVEETIKVMLDTQLIKDIGNCHFKIK